MRTKSPCQSSNVNPEVWKWGCGKDGENMWERNREEVLIEERTQKEKEERAQRKGKSVCVCVPACLHTHAWVWCECVCVGGWHKGRERWKQIGERERIESTGINMCECIGVCVCKRMTKREDGRKRKESWRLKSLSLCWSHSKSEDNEILHRFKCLIETLEANEELYQKTSVSCKSHWTGKSKC